MEAVVLKDNNEPKTEGPAQKQPIVVAEFVETPSWRSARDRKSGALKPSDERPLMEASLENSNQIDFKNPILTEEESEVIKAEKDAAAGLIGIAVAGLIVGVYFSWKWGWLKWPGTKP